MRRLMFMLVSVSLLTMLAGCCSAFHSHGICDCEEDDWCASRSPWVRTGSPAPAPVESLPAPTPAKLPDAKKVGL